MLRIGIVANEVSGDLLGAGLIRAIREREPDARFEGVAGPLMQAQGCKTLIPLERLSVMGLVEVLKHLPELLVLRRRLAAHFLAERPDIFIGIDAPDFNLGLERRLRRAGIRTLHYVSPTVWAWRPKRVEKIREAVDLLLSVFPFEVEFLRRQGLPVRYVGHPLAEAIPLETDQARARALLGMPIQGPAIALLPGSRVSEVALLARDFLDAARWCWQRRSDLRFVVPLVNARVRALFEASLREAAPELPILMTDGGSRDAIAAADVVLTASGTATLETLLSNRPMVVAYRMSKLTYRIVKTLRLLKVPYVAMANLLAGEKLAPEFIQDACRGDALGPALMAFLDDPKRRAEIGMRYREIHRELRRDTGRQAAAAVLELAAAERTRQ